MKSRGWIVFRILGAALILAGVAGRSRPAAANTVTFNSGSGIAFSYTEAGMTVVPEVSGFYLLLGDNDMNGSPDLENHPGCCSTPYRFTYNGGAAFSVAKFDFVLNAGTHTFTSSSGGSLTPGASGVVTLPTAGFTGITYLRWETPGSDQSQTAIMDNLKFCPSDCNDGNGCTDDSCDPDAPGADGNGCVHTANSASCNDGVFCNGADTCGAGSCSVHAGNPCAAGPDCNDTCNEGAHNCFAPANTPCPDDGNVCTDDKCNATGSCIHPNNAAPCNDGTFCNGADTCSGGSCVVHAGNPCTGGPECNTSCNEGAGNCFNPATTPCTDDGNVCSDDHCDGAGACIHPPNTATCDDGNACTVNDHCAGGSCSGSVRNCDDQNPCTQDSCNPTSGCVNDGAPLDGTACDDGNSCTSNDTCNGGTCAGTELPQNCDDGNPCTADGCDPLGGCTHDPVPRNGFVCDDQNPCTMQDTCNNGVCRGALTEADTDGDGYCDRVENTAGCNPNDPNEIPPQPAKFPGYPAKGTGEVILTYVSPTLAKPVVATDPACATAGTCGPIGFCSAGPVGDPCATDADCTQPPNTCRVLVNFANVPDLTLLRSRLGRTTLTSFTPLTPGCSRKVSITLDPTRRINKLRLKASGTVGGVTKRDSDSFKFLGF